MFMSFITSFSSKEKKLSQSIYFDLDKKMNYKLLAMEIVFSLASHAGFYEAFFFNKGKKSISLANSCPS